ncbi:MULTISPECIES: undecaprenyl-diphosphate phosphatase [unclassified Streptomyces]|uniref:undecaprenyl-diphosphate phosphatase n=1 Tax=unclassified Streptomyces TaxID=2593676 RepID=UPI001CD4E010|nr:MULTISPECIES: undecaprenyl-diphosphate phosphatase [unclassified Streptomyces]
MSTLTYPEAVAIGLLQGVTELFPVSSLGHSILLPALLGGHWARDLDVSAEGSPYLSVLIGMHLATALALVVYFRRDWVKVTRGLFTSVRDRRIETVEQKLAWLLIISTIPVGVAGLLLEHFVRAVLGKPIPVSIFLALNGLVLYMTERLRRGGTGRRRAGHAPAAGEEDLDPEDLSDRRLTRLSFFQGAVIGAAQIAALFPGVSRSGSTISAGILRGLSHEDSARFAFLLATPVIGAAAMLKVPELFGPAGDGVRGQAIVGSIAAFAAGYVAVAFLTRYFETRTLTPFAVYCTLAGLGSLAYFTLD